RSAKKTRRHARGARFRAGSEHIAPHEALSSRSDFHLECGARGRRRLAMKRTHECARREGESEDPLAAPYLAAALLLSACASKSELDDFDRLARTTHQQTIVLDEKLSLYSPYGPFITNEYLTEVEKQRDAVFALFDVRNDEPLLVWLALDEGMGVDESLEDG